MASLTSRASRAVPVLAGPGEGRPKRVRQRRGWRRSTEAGPEHSATPPRTEQPEPVLAIAHRRPTAGDPARRLFPARSARREPERSVGAPRSARRDRVACDGHQGHGSHHPATSRQHGASDIEERTAGRPGAPPYRQAAVGLREPFPVQSGGAGRSQRVSPAGYSTVIHAPSLHNTYYTHLIVTAARVHQGAPS